MQSIFAKSTVTLSESVYLGLKNAIKKYKYSQERKKGTKKGRERGKRGGGEREASKLIS